MFTARTMPKLSSFLKRQIEDHYENSQRAAARAWGVPWRSLNAIIKDPERVPELSTLQKIAQGLGVPLRMLVELCGYQVEDAVVDDMGLTAEERASIANLPPEQKATVLRLARQLLQQQ